MDAVKAFNNELTALYEVRPPISKAKMTSITRTAIKAIKFYKHVVQSVEKFIQKCKPEYKVPGLYVIDSIVRQSRHQFGSDKDVFAPRFAKNMQHTFANLFTCPPEDKGKIIRVLNLWQKNQVFSPEVIQPLFDQLSDPNNPIHREASTNGMNVSTQPEKSPGPKSGISSGNKVNQSGSETSTPHWLKVAQSQIDAANKAIFDLSGLAGMFNQQKNQDVLQQLQQLQMFLSSHKQDKSDPVLFDKKVLDYDYDDEDDDDKSPNPSSNNEHLNNILQNPEVMRHLTALQQQMTQHQFKQQQHEMEEKMRKLQEMKQQEMEFDKHLAQTVPKLPFASECDLKQYQEGNLADMSIPPPGYQRSSHRYQDQDERRHDSDVECVEEPNDVEVINLDRSPSSTSSRGRRRRSRSHSKSRRRNKRTRSRTRSRSRSSSRSRSKRRHRTRSRSRDKMKFFDNEKERERRKKGLPPIRRNHLSVCSTTLWIGHLSKLVQQEELSDTFGEFGDIISIDVIPPRGCAFVCMNRRQDASRALTRLKNHKLQGKSITLAWAPGRGVKGREYKDYWEIDLGVSYIPWNKLNKNSDFVELEEGGALDEDTMPDHLKHIILSQLEKKKEQQQQKLLQQQTGGLGEMPVTPSYIPLPEGLPAALPPVMSAPPPVLNVPPPVITPVSTPSTSTNIDTTLPPPNMSPAKTNVALLASAASVALTNINQGLPVMAKPGIVMPQFSFTSLPPPLGLALSNPMMSNLQMGVPPPGLLMQQHAMLGVPPSQVPPNFQQIVQPMANMGNQDLGMGDSNQTDNIRHPLQGQPIGMMNRDHDDSMEIDDDDSRSRQHQDSLPRMDVPPPSMQDKDDRQASNKDRNRRDREKSRDRRDRERDYRGNRDRDRRDNDRNRSREFRGRSRDRNERGDRGDRGGDRNDQGNDRRDQGNDRRDQGNDRRDRGNDRRDRNNRGGDRTSRDRNNRNRGDDSEQKNEAGGNRRSGWLEVPQNEDKQQSILDRMRSLSNGEPMRGPPPQQQHQQPPMRGQLPQQQQQPISLLNMPEVQPPPNLNEPINPGRQGPPIVMNFNPNAPRPLLAMLDNFRGGGGPPPFGEDGPDDPRMRHHPQEEFDERNQRGRFDIPRNMHQDDFQGPPGPIENNRSIFDRFDGPRDDMRGPPGFDGPRDDMRGPPIFDGPMDDMRGPPIFDGPLDDMRGPPGFDGPRGRDDMRGPIFDDFSIPRGPLPLFDDFNGPRMRFGGPQGPPRSLLGPLPPRGVGPMGPGLGPRFGPRDSPGGPGMRPPRPWMDNQGPPPLVENFRRPPFEERRGGGTAGGRTGSTRFRSATRWSRFEAKDEPQESPKKDTQEQQQVESQEQVKGEPQQEKPPTTHDQNQPQQEPKPLQEEQKQVRQEQELKTPLQEQGQKPPPQEQEHKPPPQEQEHKPPLREQELKLPRPEQEPKPLLQTQEHKQPQQEQEHKPPPQEQEQKTTQQEQTPQPSIQLEEVKQYKEAPPRDTHTPVRDEPPPPEEGAKTVESEN